MSSHLHQLLSTQPTLRKLDRKNEENNHENIKYVSYAFEESLQKTAHLVLFEHVY